MAVKPGVQSILGHTIELVQTINEYTNCIQPCCSGFQYSQETINV